MLPQTANSPPAGGGGNNFLFRKIELDNLSNRKYLNQNITFYFNQNITF
jgi:hypothetical protein